MLARNALADLEMFWAEQFPEVFGTDFQPLQGGYFSVDPGNADPADYPQGIGCGAAASDVENNAFYCVAARRPELRLDQLRPRLPGRPRRRSSAGSSRRW